MLTREELNRQLWGAADILRGAVDASDFKNHILSLLFLKRLSDVFFKRREQILQEWQKAGKTLKQAEKIAEDPDEYSDGAYYLPAESRWPSLMKVAESRPRPTSGRPVGNPVGLDRRAGPFHLLPPEAVLGPHRDENRHHAL